MATTQSTTAPVAQQQVSQNATALAKFTHETSDKVLTQINKLQETGQLQLPANYHTGNAIKAAWLYLQTIETRDKRKAVDVCTKESICNCLLKMATYGEHPSRHCYFIPTGNQLTFWERYTGKLMRAKRDAGIESVNAQVVYEGDNFIYTVDELGRYQLVKHETSMANIGKPIVGAYAVVVFKNGQKHLDVMSMDQIRKAWMQGATKGQSGAHTNFTDQMAKRTIINRACKVALDSAWDGMTDSDDNTDDFTMLPPSQADAERNLANAEQIVTHNGQKTNVQTGELFSEPTDAEYEDVTEGAADTRSCPV